jgi:hypothetical protein
MNWQNVIESVGGTAVAVAALAWLGRSLFTSVINRDLERARSEFAKESWHFQRSWTERERFFAGILTSLYKLEHSLSVSLDYFSRPGSEHDSSIDGSDGFQHLARDRSAALEDIHAQMGAASIHLPDRDYDKLEELFSALWNAGEDSVCTADFIRSSLQLVLKLRKEIRSSAKLALSVQR